MCPKIKMHRCRNARLLSKGKRVLVKHDMMGDDDFVGGNVNIAISLMVSGETEEDAQGRPRGELVWCGGR